MICTWCHPNLNLDLDESGRCCEKTEVRRGNWTHIPNSHTCSAHPLHHEDQENILSLKANYWTIQAATPYLKFSEMIHYSGLWKKYLSNTSINWVISNMPFQFSSTLVTLERKNSKVLSVKCLEARVKYSWLPFRCAHSKEEILVRRCKEALVHKR